MAAIADVDPQTRNHLVRAAITTFREHAFHEVTLETIAARSGFDAKVVTAHFPTLDDLIVATNEAWNTQRLSPILIVARERGAVTFLRALIRANAADPAHLRFLIGAVNIAAAPERPAAARLQALWMQFHALIEQSLTHDVEIGREPATMEPSRGADQLIALYEGLELQSLVRPQLDVVDAYDRAVARLRHGWAVPYTPPVWQI